MRRTSQQRGFTKIELIVVVVLLVAGLSILLPIIQSAREASRRAQCLNNLKQLGMATQNMHSAMKRFPSSCGVTRDADGKIVAMDGWSWCVELLPYVNQKPLWNTLDIEGGMPLKPNADGTTSHADALTMVMPELICPSFDGSPYANRNPKQAITNYKALGASHLESLNVASPNPTVPRYAPDSDRHPDGVIFPGSQIGISSIKDGCSRTILIVESVEQTVARWTVGNETCVVALPPVVTLKESAASIPYPHPTGFERGRFWDESTIPAANNKTYLDWDYDTTPYDDGGVSTAAVAPIKYGPSSHHPGVTNHLLADGSVHSFGNEMDAAFYMFWATRSGGDFFFVASDFE